jgi:hypothetical protein
MRRTRAFSLLLVLMLLAALTSLLGLVVVALPVARGEQSAARDRMQLRQEASAMLALALAEVQVAAGSDQVATWMDGDAAMASRVTAAGRESVRLAGDRRMASTNWRWRCEDVTCGFDLAGESVMSERASPWSRGQVSRQSLVSGRAVAAPSELIGRAIEWGDESIYREVADLPPASGSSWAAWGLLTDSVRGGWRRDLGDAAMLANLVGEPVARALAQADLRVERSKGLPLRCEDGPGFAFRHRAELVDLRLSLGFFNARTDGRHRLRFHVSGLLWNPSSAPLLAEQEGRVYLLEVVGAPEVTVRNLDAAASAFTVDLDDCPVGDFGIFNQYPREAGLWAWLGVDDVARYGMAQRGLLPGECYGFISPSPERQPQGLSRVLTTETWRYEAEPHGAGWKRPSPQVFLPTDRIEIALRFISPLTVRLRRVVGEPDRAEPIAAYPGPVVHEIAQVWFPDFKLELSGREYTRPDSAGYTLAERRACLRLSWVRRDECQLRNAIRQDGLLREQWDLARPEQAALWHVRHPLQAAMEPIDWSGERGIGALRDSTPNEHLAETPGAYADVRLRGVPGLPLLSVGVLRHLAPSMDWARLDDSFSSAPLQQDGSPTVWGNARLAPQLGADGKVEGWMVAGPFNVNCADPEAWLRWLRASASPWEVQPGGPFAAATLNRPFWPLQPSGAHLAQWAALRSPAWTDRELAQLPASEAAALAARQPIRFPEEATLVAMAHELVRMRTDAGAPFFSLESFARSGLLDKVLVAARCNEALGPSAAAVLGVQAEDLLEQWAPHLTVRGDTLRFVGQVAFVDPRRHGVQAVEAVFQRTPARRPDGRWGRVWKVVRVRFL